MNASALPVSWCGSIDESPANELLHARHGSQAPAAARFPLVVSGLGVKHAQRKAPKTTK
jgi:hypothetical protein